MTARLLRVDRLITLLTGISFTFLGLFILDWKYHEVFTNYQVPLATGAVSDMLAATWFPWVFAIAGVLLGLVGLYWLLAHLRREGPSIERLSASNETGRVLADFRSIAGAAADRLGALAPITGVKGTTKVFRSHTVIELHGHVDAAANAVAISQAVGICTNEIAAAFPDDDVTCRVVIDAPRRKRSRRDKRVRVR